MECHGKAPKTFTGGIENGIPVVDATYIMTLGHVGNSELEPGFPSKCLQNFSPDDRVMRLVTPPGN